MVLLIVFLLITGTFIVLYIEPHGRIANWADWRLWGLTKEQWGAIHTNLGTLFLVAMIFHIYVNWKPILKYLKNKKNKLTFFNKESLLALIITFGVIIGTYFEVPPFSSFLNFSSDIKDEAALTYGDPPYGHAELSTLKTFVKKVNLDMEKSLEILKNNHINITDIDKILLDISKENNISPQDIYTLIAQTKNKITEAGLPEIQPDGLGRRVLADLCQEYNLVIKRVVSILKQNNIDVDVSQKIKEIASSNNTTPDKLYQIIKDNYKTSN